MTTQRYNRFSEIVPEKSIVIKNLKILAESAAAPVLAVGEILPLRLDTRIGLQFEVRLRIAHAVEVEHRDKVGKEQRIDPLVHIFGTDGYEHEVDGVGFAVERTQKMVPPEGEQPSARAPESVGERRHRYAYRHELPLAVYPLMILNGRFLVSDENGRNSRYKGEKQATPRQIYGYRGYTVILPV